MKRTPGHWDWYWRVDRKRDETDCGVTSEHGYSVCRAPRHQSQEQWEADARLIAAAPRMLETLQWLDSIGGLGGPVHERIRISIAEATGEAA